KVAGADVRVFASGQALLDELWRARRADWPALLVCDIDLGDDEEDGYAVMRHVRQLDAERARDGRPPVEALALSGHAREHDRTRAVEAGFHAYLTKPAAAADLIATLRALAFSSGDIHAEPSEPGETRSPDRASRG
ncbi:response regulator, partial [Burkholderia territorii]